MYKNSLIINVFLLCTLTFFMCTSKSFHTARDILESLELGDIWTQNSEVRTFTDENLWEFINGAAEQFILYGVQTVATTDFITENNSEASVEIYHMQDDVHAFGVYALERNSEGPFLSVGTEGCWSETSLFFYKGAYYVKIISFDEEENMKGPVRSLAEKITERIPGSTAYPAAISVFPGEGLTPKTEKYYPKSVLGQSYFSNGYVAEYEIDEEPCQVFFILSKDAKEAELSYRAYRDDVQRKSNSETSPVEIGEEGFIGSDSFYKKIMAFRQGTLVGGIRGNFKEIAAKEILFRLIANASGRLSSDSQ